MKFPTFQVIVAVLTAVAEIAQIGPGESDTLPPIVIRSGTTTVTVEITVSEK
jgi:hypothetical protein